MHSMFKKLFLVFLLIIPCLSICSGCSGDGILSIQIDIASQSNTFNPLKDDSLAYLNLTIYNGDEVTNYASQYVQGEPMDMGQVDVGNFDRIVLSGHTLSGGLVAYGDMSYDGKISSDEETSVSVPFRYPLVYLAGTRLLHIFHPYRTSDLGGYTPISMANDGEITTAVATSPDGISVLGTSVNKGTGAINIWLAFSMNNVKSIEVALGVDEPVKAIKFSSDGKFAVLTSPEGNYIKIVNVHNFIAFTAKEDSILHIDLDESPSRPIDAAFTTSGKLAVLLSEDFSYNTCNNAPSSSVHFFTLADNLGADGGATDEGVTVSTDYISSMVSNPVDGRLFLSHPCAASISQVTAGSQVISPMLNVNNLLPCFKPVNLAVGDNTLFSTCYTVADTISPTWTEAKLLIQRFSLMSGSLTGNPLIMDYPQEAFYANATSSHPSGTIQHIQSAETLLPKDFTVTVKSGRIALSIEAYFNIRSVNVGGSVLNGFKRKTHSLLFIDPSAEAVSNRFRSACYSVLSETDPPPAELTSSYCAPMANVFQPTIEFIPGSVASLYGFQ
ncbi:WD40 repeat domain-containing protein [Myxococcota bacterium]|nr:WD40 repeat domain-containing protein [Myxococcota bacterium]MBU1498492.1 WD40 repeat domain-containing protein [Myxococcota bacterium]